MAKQVPDRRATPRLRLALFGMPLLAATAIGAPTVASASTGSSASAAQLFQTALKSSAAASSFSVKGSINQPKQDISLNLTVGASGTSEGSITINGGSVKIIESGDTAYFNADTKFGQENGGGSATQLLAGRWVYGPTTSSPFSSFKSFLSTRGFIKLFLGSDTGPFTKGRATTFDNVQSIPIKANGPGTLYVAAAGGHLVVGAKGSKGGVSASLAFNNYNRHLRVSKPSGGISLQGLESGGS
jgi:hypothetical protein